MNSIQEIIKAVKKLQDQVAALEKNAEPMKPEKIPEPIKRRGRPRKQP